MGAMSAVRTDNIHDRGGDEVTGNDAVRQLHCCSQPHRSAALQPRHRIASVGGATHRLSRFGRRGTGDKPAGVQ